MGRMRVLVLGGTKFLDRAIVVAALGSGDTVTLFDRGKTNPEAQLEDAPVAEPREGGFEEIYGPNKASCEQIVQDTHGERALIGRPGLIVGPHDPTDRFPYWPRRIARGGQLLAPGDPADLAQFIDVRDLASWLADASQISGRFGVARETAAHALRRPRGCSSRRADDGDGQDSPAGVPDDQPAGIQSPLGSVVCPTSIR
jgi:nucleoside-diphosphate-sugar epimerase